MPIETIKTYLKSVPKTSGVYQFMDAKDQVLYVGKAKNLLKRVTSYTKPKLLSGRIARMVFLAQKLEFTRTNTELDALLLEHNLIKKLEPRYNILLRDGKTFPQIVITDHDFPQITKYRGAKSDKGHHFGPFASGFDVNRTIEVLKKSFMLRSCSDSEFKSRKKPCLEYQIKRCSGPCTRMIPKADYEISVKNAVDFLKGRSAEVQKNLAAKMKFFSENQNYEKAAEIRDQIRSLNAIQAKQSINIEEIKDTDLIILIAEGGVACIYISFFRGGQNYGARPYFYEIDEGRDPKEFLSEFLGQFYISQTPPSLVLINSALDEKNLMEDFLSKIGNKKVEIKIPQAGAKRSLIKDHEQIAKQILEQRIAQNFNNKELLLEVQRIFELEKSPNRIEVYDNSHTSGTNAVGALITAGPDGFIKSGYRKFNIRFDEFKNRDDTSMLREVLSRRFSKLEKKEWPDLIIIDGGKGQMSAAKEIFESLNVDIPFVCMSKGENRNAGEEFFHRPGKESFTLPKHAPVMYYLQRLRDEAHRFAIMTHRKKRSKSMLIPS